MIDILSNGALNLVQDVGRPGYLDQGVCRSGAMDLPALALANMLVGNDESAAGIEISIFPFRLRCGRDSVLACTGAVTTLDLAGRAYPSWWVVQARAGDVLTIVAPVQGARAYLALRGGLDVPLLLGSRATDLKSGFGGLEGRGLRKGDQIALLSALSEQGIRYRGVTPKSRRDFATALSSDVVLVRALPGVEYRAFAQVSRLAFANTTYQLTPECNRQGYRLRGTPLQLCRPLELLSYGVVPGTVQVPPDGQPIVQLAEANTIGGYPRMATIIEADLWCLAQLRPGQRLRFALVEHNEALMALREQAEELARIRHAWSFIV